MSLVKFEVGKQYSFKFVEIVKESGNVKRVVKNAHCYCMCVARTENTVTIEKGRENTYSIIVEDGVEVAYMPFNTEDNRRFSYLESYRADNCLGD